MASDRRDRIFSEFRETVNMSPSELEAWRDSENRDSYAERKSGGQPIDEPLEDVLKLKRKNKDQWKCEDDGFNECEQAKEAVNFINRMSAAEQGDPMPGTDPPLSKRDASLLNWGHDPSPGSRDFGGDRQR